MKKILAFILFIFVYTSINAQLDYGIPVGLHQQQMSRSGMPTQNKKGFDLSKLTFGGGFGLQFGDYTVVNVAPQVGYNFTDWLNAGAGLNYTHYSESYNSISYRWKESTNYFGMNVYARVYPIPNIILMVQPEGNRMWKSLSNKSTREKWTDEKFIPSVLVGGGLRLGPVTAMIQYDVVQDENSPYGDRMFYSLGYMFSF